MPPPAPGDDADAVEGIMIKRRDATYVPGRPKGPWWKWKRDPFTVDAVLMYAQRGSGKRSSYYSDYTFGVWTKIDDGDELVPVGKAYFGFTDEELLKIDRYVRSNTVERFGPVREVKYGPDEGLVLEVAFEGLQRSTRHKSGLAMRFPRISRLRWDKPPREADRLETLEKILQGIESAPAQVPVIAAAQGRAPDPCVRRITRARSIPASENMQSLSRRLPLSVFFRADPAVDPDRLRAARRSGSTRSTSSRASSI